MTVKGFVFLATVIVANDCDAVESAGERKREEEEGERERVMTL